MPSKIWAAVRVAALVLASLIAAAGCTRSEGKQGKQEDLGSRSLALTQPPGAPGASCGRFVGQLPNGSVRYAVTFSQPQAFVQVFVQQNGIQNIATNIVSNAVNNGNGTYSYSFVAPATGYHSGDRLRTRFYSYGAGQPGVFTPGPTDTTWAPDFIYGQTTCSSPPPSGCHAYITTQTNGDLRFAVTLPGVQQFVQVFVQQNGVQNVAQNIVSSRVANPNGTSTYSLVKPAAGYHAGDLILTRFYSYVAGQPGVYTPGPIELMWAPEFTVGSVCGSIDDGNPCTVDANGPSGPTHTPVANGTACNDGNACTQSDTCQSGACTGANLVVCTAQGVCRDAGTCNPTTGACSSPAKADGTACNNATVCDGAETCQAGACANGVALVVDDTNPCTVDACDPVSGVSHTPRTAGTACDNATLCDGRETCNSAGQCSPGTLPLFDDGNPCTTDACGALIGVTHTPVANGIACNDGNACTQSDTCQSGACTGANLVVCTAQGVCRDAGTCNPTTGACSSPAKPDGTACNNATVCDGAETCQAGACATGVALVVDDTNPCTVDACDPVSGVIHTPRAAGTACDNATVCDGRETCNSTGQCGAGTVPVFDDGNPCTTDACDALIGATHTPVANGTACNDGNACTQTDTCQGGSCVGAQPVVCSVLDSCHAAGVCSPATGTCSNPAKPVGSSCDDGNVCDGGATCNGAGHCAGGTPIAVDDHNPCTVDACDPVAGVTHTPLAAGSSCSDGNACNGTEVCGATGTCQPGTPVNTDSGNDCTVGVCDPATGVVTFVPGAAGSPCFADLCSQGACTAEGECLPTGASGLDDGDPCTLEWCDPALGPQVRTCTALDPTIGTTLFDATQWLYSGTDPVQQGVAPGTIVAERAATLQGSLLNREGLPLSGARISVLDHPELGWTITRADGAFDLVVNGGGNLMVEYQKDGYLAVQRRVHAAWGEYAQLPPVTLIPSDPVATTVDLNATELQVAMGSEQTDDSGSRKGTLLIPGGTEATMHLVDGTEVPLDSMSVRITEFTVGASGPQAMPGPLPSQSHYTYAFEVNADEAVEQGAPEVSFSQPLVYYVDNFLDFPAGTVVPLGSYDRRVGTWKAEESGIVLKIVGATAGAAAIDVTGDGVADSNLAAFGITLAEQQKLAELYARGQSLWRVQLKHFTTPWDCNWGISPPDDAHPPDPDPKGPEPCNDKCCGPQSGPPDDVQHASTISCREQVLKERIPVAGTELSLNYASNRVKGRRTDYRIEVPISGVTVPASLKRIDLEVTIAGRATRNSYSPTPGQTLTFEWDGLDKWGREMQGSQAYNIKIDYVYNGVYTRTSRFGYNGEGTVIKGDIARGELFLGRTWQLAVGTYQATEAGFGGWTLSAHHAYEPVARRINYGTGSRRDDATLPPVVKVLSGRTGSAPPVDGGSALGANLINEVVVDSQGRAFSTNQQANQIFRINRDSTLTLIAPGEDWGGGSLSLPIGGLDIGPDDSLYVLDAIRRVIKRVYPDGTVTTVAGNGTNVHSGDGGLATMAGLATPQEIAVSRDGDIYIYQTSSFVDGGRLRRVSPDGTISTVAGNGCFATPTNPAGKRALDACLRLWSIAVDPKGIAYGKAQFVEGGVTYTNVIRFAADGTIETVAGTHTPCASCGVTDGRHPLDTILSNDSPQLGHMNIDERGTIYVVDPLVPPVIRAIEVDKSVRSVVGEVGGGFVALADGLPATRVASSGSDVFPGPDGLYLMLSGQTNSIARVAVPLPSDTAASFLVGNGGDEFDTFDQFGRHVATRHGLTGANLLAFSHGASGLLESITDVAGQRTQVVRDAAGRATAIVGPYGQRTELEIGADGYLASVTNPEGDRVAMGYTPGGLLTSFTDARGNQSVMSYDAAGRLESDEDAVGGRHELTRTETVDGSSVTRTTALNRSTTYDVQRLTTGEVINTTTLPDGTIHTSRTNRDRIYRSTLPDGTSITESELPDQRLGLSWPLVSRTTTLPSGLSNVETQTRSYINLDPTNLLSFTSRTDTRTVNDDAFTTTYAPATRTFTTVSPQGRRFFRTIDAFGRTVQASVNGFAPVDLVYDTQGRLQRVQQGGRTSANTFVASGPSAGYLETITDALGLTTNYTKDSIGRPLSETREGAATLFSWDANGNLARVTPPERPEHDMLYTPVNLLETYVAPAAGLTSSQTGYSYDLDRALSVETHPDGRVIDHTYDAAGRLDLMSIPGGMIDYQYYPPGSTAGGAAPGQPSALLGPYGTNLTYQYDGKLVTRATWSGDVSGNVAFAFNNAFKPSGFTVNGVSGTGNVSLGYDRDQLLICASPTTCSPAGADALRVTRRFDNGLPSRIDLANVGEDVTYTTLGELATQVGTFSAAPLASFTYDAAGATRDALGRVVQKTEVVQGTTKVWRYGYDGRNRLADVFLDGALREHFDYDLNGNRTGYMSAATGTISGTCDDQDRLLTYGAWHFTYGANGELEGKTNTATGEAWVFRYDVLGNLLAVTLPNGDLIEYLVDGKGRRVGRKLNGVFTNRWLYQDGLRPVAELDASGALLATYVYGTKSNAPDLVLRGGQAYRVFSDQLGSPRLVVNASNASDVPYSATYEAFGEVAGTGLAWMPFGFAGGMYDPATRLLRFGARDYDPSVGRWISKDPIRFGGGQANIYAYVNNDPVNLLDPSGTGPVAAGVVFGLCTAYDVYSTYSTIQELGKVEDRIKELRRRRDEAGAKALDCDDAGAEAEALSLDSEIAKLEQRLAADQASSAARAALIEVGCGVAGVVAWLLPI